MTRVKISVGILCMLVVLSVFSTVWVNVRCKGLLDSISDISECVDEGNMDKAAGLAEELENDWEKFRSKAAVLLNNGRLSEIDRISSRVVFLIRNNSDEVYAELTELRHMIETLKKGDTPLLTSVF